MVKKKIENFFVLSVILMHVITVGLIAIDFKYKQVEDFPTLSKFENIEAFEDNYKAYEKNCLDNTFGGSAGIPCFVGYELWDRELNVYYIKLLTKFDASAREILKQSQRVWLNERDLSIKFNSALLDKKYLSKQGTMYQLMRAGDADRMIVPIVKHRALVLKRWLEYK